MRTSHLPSFLLYVFRSLALFLTSNVAAPAAAAPSPLQTSNLPFPPPSFHFSTVRRPAGGASQPASPKFMVKWSSVGVRPSTAAAPPFCFILCPPVRPPVRVVAPSEQLHACASEDIQRSEADRRRPCATHVCMHVCIGASAEGEGGRSGEEVVARCSVRGLPPSLFLFLCRCGININVAGAAPFNGEKLRLSSPATAAALRRPRRTRPTSPLSALLISQPPLLSLTLRKSFFLTSFASCHHGMACHCQRSSLRHSPSDRPPHPL